jgi:hypothetical protein
LPARAQPSPKLLAPTTRSAPQAFVPNIGPPESPWQVSTPPSGKPAKTIVAASKSEYACAQYASVVIGTRASWSVSGASPPSSVAPQPTIVSRSPGSQAERSPAPATLTGALVEAGWSWSSEMS